MSNNKCIENNVELVRAMNTVISFLNDEGAIEPWLMDYPDGADEDDLCCIAEDNELMDWLCANFKERIRRSGKHGWYTFGGAVYGKN